MWQMPTRWYLRITQVLETVLLLHLAGSLESEAPRKFDHIYMFAKLGDFQVCPSQKKTYIFSEGMFRMYIMD